jgi:hypothetical protein
MRHNVVLLGADGRESKAKVRHYAAAAATLGLDVVDYPDSRTLGIVSCSDFRAAEASWLAQAHGIPSADPLAATIATSKSLVYQAMQRAGFDSLWFCIPRRDEDLLRASHRGAVIVKPDRGSGSFAEHPWAYRIFDSVSAFRETLIEEDLLEAFLAYQNDPPLHHGAYLVMEFVDSHLSTTAAVVGPQDIVFYESGTVEMAHSEWRLKGAWNTLGWPDPAHPARAFVEALAHQGLTRSVVYVQSVEKNGRLYPIDFNLRPSTMGDYAIDALGLPFYEAALAFQLGLSSRLEFQWPQRCIAIRRVLVPLVHGERSVDYGPDCVPLVHAVHYDDSRPYDVGDAWPMFAVTGDSVEACRARAEAIAQAVTANLTPGAPVERVR